MALWRESLPAVLLVLEQLASVGGELTTNARFLLHTDKTKGARGQTQKPAYITFQVILMAKPSGGVTAE